jgi:RHS repeat-associated protein
LVAELNATNNALVRSYVWGTDLSGSAQRAGGVGGLISMTMHTGAEAGTYFYGFDGNANVLTLANAANGTIAAQYEYDPFHNRIRATGLFAFLNPFLGATKFFDWETGLYYYGYRYYGPSTGRWLSRDPMGIRGGRNPFAFVDNDPIRKIDFLGLCKIGDKTNFTCEPKVLHWATTPDYDKALDEFYALINSIDNLADLAELITGTWGQGADAVIAAVGQFLLDKGIKEINANDVYNLAKKAAEEGHAKMGGYKLWTRIRYKECECGFLGLGTKWKEKTGPWKWFQKKTKHSTYEFTYELKMLGYADADEACAAYLEEFTK